MERRAPRVRTRCRGRCGRPRGARTDTGPAGHGSAFDRLADDVAGRSSLGRDAVLDPEQLGCGCDSGWARTRLRLRCHRPTQSLVCGYRGRHAAAAYHLGGAPLGHHRRAGQPDGGLHGGPRWSRDVRPACGAGGGRSVAQPHPYARRLRDRRCVRARWQAAGVLAPRQDRGLGRDRGDGPRDRHGAHADRGEATGSTMGRGGVLCGRACRLCPTLGHHRQRRGHAVPYTHRGWQGGAGDPQAVVVHQPGVGHQSRRALVGALDRDRGWPQTGGAVRHPRAETADARAGTLGAAQPAVLPRR